MLSELHKLFKLKKCDYKSWKYFFYSARNFIKTYFKKLF